MHVWNSLQANLALFGLGKPYIKKEHFERVRNHRPNCTNLSVYYHKVLSPCCDAIVERLPAWLAPNVITVWGFCWILASLLLTVVLYGNSADGYYSPYLCIFSGIAFFIYNVADNCDGKQARKHGTGSTLGMLFDHGLDACVAVAMCIVLARMLQVGTGPMALLAMQVSTVPFYYITMEEYFIGKMTLPAIGGPDDMALVVTGLCFLGAHLGTKMSTEVSLFSGLPPMKISAIGTVVLWNVEMVAVIGSLVNYWRARAEPHLKARFTWRCFLRLGGYMLLNVVIYNLYGIACSDVLYTHTRLVVLAFGGQYLQVTLRMVVSNATGDEVDPIHWTALVSWGLLCANMVSFVANGAAFIPDVYVFWAINALAWCSVAHYGFSVIGELKDILGIYMFKVGRKEESQSVADVYVTCP